MDSEAFATLSRIALRADNLLALAAQAHIPPEHVRADAARIRELCDQARRQIAGQAQRVTENVQ